MAYEHTGAEPRLACCWKSEKPKCTVWDTLKNIAPETIQEYS